MSSPIVDLKTQIAKIQTQIAQYKGIIPTPLQKELNEAITKDDFVKITSLFCDKVAPLIVDYMKQVQNHNLNDGEQILWMHSITKGIFKKETIEKWMITNLRALKYFLDENRQERMTFVPLALSETVVMNQHRATSGNRVGTFVGSGGGRGFVGTSTGSSKSTSVTYGDLVFLYEGKETLRFCGISDPNGVHRLINTIKKSKS